jgi:hypothetical protein
MTPTIATIRRAVAEAAGITEEAIVGFEQARAVARPRQVAMYLCRRNGPWSLSAIGAEFGKHHTTVTAAITAISGLVRHGDAATIALLRAAEQRLAAPDAPPPAEVPVTFRRWRKRKWSPPKPPKPTWESLLAGRRFEDVPARDDGPLRRLPPPTLSASATTAAAE